MSYRRSFPFDAEGIVSGNLNLGLAVIMKRKTKEDGTGLNWVFEM